MQDSNGRIQIDGRVHAYLKPVWSVLEAGLSRLPPGPEVHVEFGSVKGFASLDGRRLRLSEELEGPEVYHSGEHLLRLDRWRRGAACILEACAMLALAQSVGRSPQPNWKWVGASIYVADAVAPELALAKSSLAIAIRSGDPGRYPRAGFAVYRAWEAQGDEVWARIMHVLEEGIVSAPEWLAVGQWIYDAEHGARSLFSVPVDRPEAVDVPVTLRPWSWRALAVPAHQRGGQVIVEGEGVVADPWGVAHQPLRTLAACSGSACSLRAVSGGPVGRWTVSSLQGFGQIMGARGMDFDFQSSGVLQIVLADACGGPLAAIALAEQMGTSGIVDGRWKVGGPLQLGFEGIQTASLTMHGRDADPFAVPASGFGMSEWIQALEKSPWWWEVNGSRLVMRGEILGEMIEVRLRKNGQ